MGTPLVQGLEAVRWDADYFLTRSWMRYFLATLCRSIPYGATPQQQALACVGGQSYSALVGGPGDTSTPPWLVAYYPAGSGSGGGPATTLIALGGSTTWLTFLQHALGVNMTTWPGPGRVSSFWVTCAGNMLANVVGAVPGPLGKVILTGFSWGGAVAQILSYYLSAGGATGVQTVTFGAPKVGNQAFSDGYNAYLDRQENPWDPVVYLPPYMSMATRLAVSGGNVFQFPQNYVAAGADGRWPNGFGHTPNYFVGALGGLEGRVWSQSITGGTVNRNHSLYYYAKKYFYDAGGLEAAGGGDVASLQNGFDLAGLYTANTQLSVLDGLVVTPAFPVPASAEP